MSDPATDASEINLAGRRAPRSSKWPTNPGLAVDAVWIQDGEILLVRRGHAPFRGRWALPGGFVEGDEPVEAAVRRELREETGLRARVVDLIGVYSGPGRDPRGATVSLAFRMAGRRGIPRGGDDAAEASWHPVARLPRLAFDHGTMVRDARRRRAAGARSRT